MAEIRIDYSLAISKANKIKELAEDVARVSQKLTLLKEDTEEYWQGEAASVYRNQCESLENYLKNTNQKMETLANTIIKIANLIKEADEANARAAASMSPGIGGTMGGR